MQCFHKNASFRSDVILFYFRISHIYYYTFCCIYSGLKGRLSQTSNSPIMKDIYSFSLHSLDLFLCYRFGVWSSNSQLDSMRWHVRFATAIIGATPDTPGSEKIYTSGGVCVEFIW